jgi:glycosyltransferase involved in cell wall biosynthesis
VELELSSSCVSVIIPTHNRASFLSRSIDSVLAQTHPQLEVIIVDDGSDDETSAVVAGYEDERVRALTLPSRSGPSAARNNGIRAAGGRFVSFLDSDDEWLPRKVERQLNAFATSGRPGVVLTGVWVDDGFSCHAEVPKSDWTVFEKLLGLSGVITTSGLMVDREIVRDELYFDESLPALEERDLLVRIGTKHSIRHVPEPLYVWHHHSGPRASDFDRQILARRLFIEKHASELELRPRLAASHHFRLALIQVRSGDKHGARRSIAAAARLDRSNRRLQTLNVAGWLGSHGTSLALQGYAALGRVKRGLR